MNVIALLFGLGSFFWLLAICAFIFWVWMLVDCLKRETLNGSQKIAWVLVLVFLYVFGAIPYIILAKGSKGSLKEPKEPRYDSPWFSGRSGEEREEPKEKSEIDLNLEYYLRRK
jgi:hypothetical protein